jgi:cystathionine gamma-synthase/methionine-gamma-lyase
MPTQPAHSHTSTRGLFTAAVHSGQVAPKPGQPSAPPIVTASGWTHVEVDDLDAALGDERAGYVYSRDAAPTQEAFEAAMVALENGAGAAAFASGMAALHAALLVAGMKSGQTIVAASELYGKTGALLNRLSATSGLAVLRTNVRDLAATEALLARAPGSLLLFEVISNPLCRIADAPALIKLARQYQVKTIVDSTFATPYLIQPLTQGADIVVHSATKYIGGHGDLLGGVAVAAASDDAMNLRLTRSLFGSNLSPFDAYLALRGLRTLPLRVREQNQNALKLAQWLAAHPRVARVHYAGLPDNPDHALAQRIFGAGCFGAMLALDLKDATRTDVFHFMSKLNLIQRIATLGDVATLVAYPAHASHRALSPEQRAALGIGDNCVRISVGIEDAADLIADLEQALQ